MENKITIVYFIVSICKYSNGDINNPSYIRIGEDMRKNVKRIHISVVQIFVIYHNNNTYTLYILYLHFYVRIVTYQ